MNKHYLTGMLKERAALAGDLSYEPPPWLIEVVQEIYAEGYDDGHGDAADDCDCGDDE